jgi:MFS family permease
MSFISQHGYLAAFRYRNYRYFWTATMFASAGRWMEAVLFAWIVLQMTGSPFLVGAVSACRWIGYGFGPIAGAIADRYDKRKILLIITSSSVLYSFILAFGVALDLFEYWHVMAIALLAGIAHGFDMPLRFAFTADIVDKSVLTNAFAFNTAAMEVTAVLGPAIAGLLIKGIGEEGVTWVLCVNYALNVFVLYMIRDLVLNEKPAGGSVAGDLKMGLRYVWSNPTVFALIGITVVFALFQWPLRHALVPVFARDVLRVGADGYGFLLAASGMGALVGAAIVAGLGDFRHKAWLCIVTSLAAGIAATAFSLSPWYSLSLGIMGCVGIAETTSSITLTTLLMLVTPNEMRGRVMGVRSFAVLFLSLGSLMAGAMAGQFDAPTAGTVNATLHILSILIIVLTVQSLRRSG